MQYRITFSPVTTTVNCSLPTEDVNYYTITRNHVIKTDARNLSREVEFYVLEVGLAVVSLECRSSRNEEWKAA